MEDSHCKTGDSSHQEVDDAFAGFNTVHTQENIHQLYMNVQSSNEQFVLYYRALKTALKVGILQLTFEYSIMKQSHMYTIVQWFCGQYDFFFMFLKSILLTKAALI